ncbi:hypothetical protein ACFXG4_16870, partial [Nocardia sp. NPDC059246]
MRPNLPESAAARLRDRQQYLIDRYRTELEHAGSALVSDSAVWEECVVQARQIIGECAESLGTGQAGRVEVPVERFVNMAERRGIRGIRPDCSVRAAVIMFELVM